jgi:hypothetical protein
MATRRVTGVIRKINNQPWGNAELSFEIDKGTFTTEANFPLNNVQVRTDASGLFEVELWCNSEGTIPTEYICSLPDRARFNFVLTPGTTPVSLQFLRAQGVQPTPIPQTILDYIDGQIGAGGGGGGGTSTPINSTVKVNSNTVITAQPTKIQTFLVDAAAGAVTLDLPVASASNSSIVRIKKVDSTQNPVIVKRSASDLIDGAISQTLFAQFDALDFVADSGSNTWSIF